MFRGSVPADLQSLIVEYVREWSCTEIGVACSGNFTIERVLAPLGRFAFHSNDVTLYSSAIGWYLAGEPLPLTLKPEWAEPYGWMDEYLQHPVAALATVMLCTRMLQGLTSTNPYYEKMRNAWKQQWPELHAQTIARIQKTDLHLASYFCGDGVQFAHQLPPEVGVIAFPPFFNGDYEAQFRGLDALFDWPTPLYGQIDAGWRHELISAVSGRPAWMLVLHDKEPLLEPYWRGMVQTTNRGVPIYVYASHGKSRTVVPRQDIEPVAMPRLGPRDTIQGPLALHPLTGGQFAALRSQYMNAGIKPGSPTVAIGVSAGGKLIGCYALSTPSAAASWDSQVQMPYLYLLSDFPVAPVKYAHLAKLILYAALSTEGQRLAERTARSRVRTLITTAFTNRPVSMKYRGIFTLVNRKETEPAPEGTPPEEGYYHQKYMLNYAARTGNWSLASGLAEWQQKYGAKQKEGD